MQICTKINSTFAATCHGAFFDLLEFIPSLVIVVKVGTVMLSIMRIKVVYFAPVPGSRPVRVPIIFPLDIKNCSHDHFRTLSDEKGVEGNEISFCHLKCASLRPRIDCGG